ncbi:hypothetical protein GSU75_05251 [Pseudomonas savastanoi pv. phaseolicola]|nr:hypothetical protein [Pseudomonas savastanoi pv. phaseolicola]MBN4184098.1 hypothetical protein [Pseudomonas savastanoi pv. phaseolicola]
MSFDTGMANDYKCAMLYDNLRLAENYNHKNNSKSNKSMTSLISQAIKKFIFPVFSTFSHDCRRITSITLPKTPVI